MRDNDESAPAEKVFQACPAIRPEQLSSFGPRRATIFGAVLSAIGRKTGCPSWALECSRQRKAGAQCWQDNRFMPQVRNKKTRFW